MCTPNLDYNKLKVTLGRYEKFYIGTTNSTKQRMVGATALRLENKQGIYYFMYRAAWKQLHTFIWTELTINDQVIYRVKDLDTKEKH